MGDVTFHIVDSPEFVFSQPLPPALQAAISHVVDHAAELCDLERVAVSVQGDGGACTGSLPLSFDLRLQLATARSEPPAALAA